MYEETRSSIDWKGLFLKVIIAFLIILIGFKAYSTLKGNDNKTNAKTTTETIAKSKTSSTFTANIEKLKKAGEQYFTKNKDKLPKTEGNTVMVTLNELINSGDIEKLADEDGKNCDGESSYVTAMLEGEKTKIKANLVCGSASSYSLVYMGQNDNTVEKTKTTSSSSNNSYSTSTTSTKNTTSNSNTKTTSCGSSCGTPSVTVSTNTSVSNSININSKASKDTSSKKTTSKNTISKNTNNIAYTTDKVTVSFDSNGGNKTYATQRVVIGDRAFNPGSTSKSGYTFTGWYLNGYKYDFSTPVTENITLVAKFSRNTYYDDYDYRYYDDYYYDDYNYTRTTTTNVYTMGWDSYNASQVTISHKLALPDLDEDYRYIRISKVEYVKPINTTDLASTYRSRHASTFLYAANGWESYNDKSSSFATVSNARIVSDSNYKTKYEAATQGFNVTWTSTYISDRCTKPFTVTSTSGETAKNKCNYGIVYRVTWEYIK